MKIYAEKGMSRDLQGRKKAFRIALRIGNRRPAACVLAFFSVVASYSNLSTCCFRAQS
ncbi:hypothetical protein Bache_0755 [Bacteroides helcogenes P 36-108]|uniref:Uncharacterized protein n=1 Tax=Bacteroides helcogenes (strain ATCC 35417 / DSM 20613 / JCM 6297 / CCUG 15421 / P 36-108) TaxID=693979 RepID=E6SNV9_BACT6|nr:hypothetical protein Bache_0755 [Bacteroides helcogenes P 36-108]